jgi:hypothetical protein
MMRVSGAKGDTNREIFLWSCCRCLESMHRLCSFGMLKDLSAHKRINGLDTPRLGARH